MKKKELKKEYDKLVGAFEVGEYVAIKENPAVGGAHMMVIHNPYADMKDWGQENGNQCLTVRVATDVSTDSVLPATKGGAVNIG